MHQHNLEQEAAILRKIQGVVPLVPRLVAHDDQYDVLLLEPVGVQFASRATHFTQQTVRVTPLNLKNSSPAHMHTHTLEHAQITWCRRSSCRCQTTTGISKVGEVYMPRFSDDLEMVVRSVFHSLSMPTFEQVRLEEECERDHESDMLAAAQREDYAGLKMHIRNILP